MKHIVYFLMFISLSSNASDSTYYNYFRGFSAIFSRSAISEYDYSKLSSYKLTPALFINFDKTPPETYNDNERKNPNVIFNGAVSKKYFLKFINSSLLQNNAVNVNAKKQFVNDTGSYTFIATIRNENLLIIENILISTPYDMDAEISCTYKFSLLSKDKLMLSDVVCAG